MTHRIPTKLLGAVAAATLLAALPAAAHAGPTHQQPATKVVTKSDARKVADYGVHAFMQGLPKPRRYEIGDCMGLGNPKLQRCLIEMTAPDTRCTATIWVWQDSENFYWEWHNLRCSG